MKKRLSSVLCAMLAVIFITAPFSHAFAAETEPDILSGQALIYNIKYDTLLFSKGADESIYPASFAKLMTALLGFEYYKNNRGASINITQEMLSGGGSSLKAGETLSFESLLKLLVIYNSNDAAQVIACIAGGSIEGFVNMMNEKAKALGMENTYYANPTGVDSSLMHTTLKDTLILCREIYKVNDFMVMASLPFAEIPATELTPERRYANKNLLANHSFVYDYYYKGTNGMIAGYTAGAGYCVASAHAGDDGMMIAIVSGGMDTSESQNGGAIQSYYDSKKLYEWADEAFDAVLFAKKDDILCEKKVLLGSDSDHVILGVKNDAVLLVPSEISADMDNIKVKIKMKSDADALTAPVVKGMVYGTAEYYYAGVLIGTAEITALSNINRSPLLTVFAAVQRFFSQGIPRLILILIILAVILYILILIGIVLVQYLRKNREKNIVMAQIEDAENRRLDKVKEKEKLIRSARRRRLKKAVREGFMALTAYDEELPNQRAVARVPEKYRKTYAPPRSNNAANIRRAPNQRAGVKKSPNRANQNPRSPRKNNGGFAENTANRINKPRNK